MMVLGSGAATAEETPAATEDKARRWSGSKRLRAAEPAAGSLRATHMMENENVRDEEAATECGGSRTWRQAADAAAARPGGEAAAAAADATPRAPCLCVVGCVWKVESKVSLTRRTPNTEQHPNINRHHQSASLSRRYCNNMIWNNKYTEALACFPSDPSTPYTQDRKSVV